MKMRNWQYDIRGTTDEESPLTLDEFRNKYFRKLTKAVAVVGHKEIAVVGSRQLVPRTGNQQVDYGSTVRPWFDKPED